MERLQKYLARAGVASRRRAEELIRGGHVAVNGQIVVDLGVKVDPGRDAVTVDGVTVGPPRAHRYVLLNKPAGVVTTLVDPQGRPTVAEFVPPDAPRLFPVGRLDYNTTGLLLLTNDGDLAHALMHPRYHVPKTYRALVEGVPDGADLERLRTGVLLDDGLTAPAEVSVAPVGPDAALVTLTIREGRKRQVRRMLSAVGHPVRTLARVAFGPLTDEDLPIGSTRELTPAEVEALRAAVAACEPPKRSVGRRP